MNEGVIIDIVQDTLLVIIKVSAPPLIFGLVVGVLVSIFQTLTSIQEPTLAFVPKILAVLFSLIIFGSFMLTSLQDYMIQLFERLPELMRPK